jgi:hypothetical protein
MLNRAIRIDRNCATCSVTSSQRRGTYERTVDVLPETTGVTVILHDGSAVSYSRYCSVITTWCYTSIKHKCLRGIDVVIDIHVCVHEVVIGISGLNKSIIETRDYHLGGEGDYSILIEEGEESGAGAHLVGHGGPGTGGVVITGEIEGNGSGVGTGGGGEERGPGGDIEDVGSNWVSANCPQ